MIHEGRIIWCGPAADMKAVYQRYINLYDTEGPLTDKKCGKEKQA